MKYEKVISYIQNKLIEEDKNISGIPMPTHEKRFVNTEAKTFLRVYGSSKSGDSKLENEPIVKNEIKTRSHNSVVKLEKETPKEPPPAVKQDVKKKPAPQPPKQVEQDATSELSVATSHSWESICYVCRQKDKIPRKLLLCEGYDQKGRRGKPKRCSKVSHIKCSNLLKEPAGEWLCKYHDPVEQDKALSLKRPPLKYDSLSAQQTDQNVTAT